LAVGMGKINFVSRLNCRLGELNNRAFLRVMRREIRSARGVVRFVGIVVLMVVFLSLIDIWGKQLRK